MNDWKVTTSISRTKLWTVAQTRREGPLLWPHSSSANWFEENGGREEGEGGGLIKKYIIRIFTELPVRKQRNNCRPGLALHSSLFLI